MAKFRFNINHRRARCFNIEQINDYRVIVGSEVNSDKGEPNDASTVHGESNVLGLVEVFRNFSSFESIIGT